MERLMRLSRILCGNSEEPGDKFEILAVFRTRKTTLLMSRRGRSSNFLLLKQYPCLLNLMSFSKTLVSTSGFTRSLSFFWYSWRVFFSGTPSWRTMTEESSLPAEWSVLKKYWNFPSSPSQVSVDFTSCGPRTSTTYLCCLNQCSN